MEYDSELYMLSKEFMQAYPENEYPELMYKQGRPYTCLLIDSHQGYFICVPFRSSIGHKNAFIFRKTKRSRKTRSGLDYSKIVIIQKSAYLDSSNPVVVDQDEYKEMVINLPIIVCEVMEYIDTYIRHFNKIRPIHPSEFERKYKYSTLRYFHKLLGIS